LTSREAFTESLKSYKTNFKEEEPFIKEFLNIIQSPRCYHRDHLPGHITASSWIVDESKTHALLVHHVKLKKWLQPGGHADGNEHVLNVALREASEETGLTNLVHSPTEIFDLDIHSIPARKDFPEHLHYDIRFAFSASRNSTLKISNESHDLRWIGFDEIPALTNQNISILRMIRKTLGGNQH
jgi:8-oxo-dGTP pyrophosphatase MutT (NUDIX family)